MKMPVFIALKLATTLDNSAPSLAPAPTQIPVPPALVESSVAHVFDTRDLPASTGDVKVLTSGIVLFERVKEASTNVFIHCSLNELDQIQMRLDDATGNYNGAAFLGWLLVNPAAVSFLYEVFRSNQIRDFHIRVNDQNPRFFGENMAEIAIASTAPPAVAQSTKPKTSRVVNLKLPIQAPPVLDYRNDSYRRNSGECPSPNSDPCCQPNFQCGNQFGITWFCD